MPTNNTENIYSTPFNEGEAQPIPASRIGYNNTSSGLTADDVQSAIDEVASSIGGKWVKDRLALYTIAVTADGTKTWNDLFQELATEMATMISNLGDDEIIVPKVLFAQGISWMGIVGTDYFKNGDTTFNPVFNRVQISNSKLTCSFSKLSNNAGNNDFHTSETVAAGTTTFRDVLLETPNVNTTLSLLYDKLKQV